MITGIAYVINIIGSILSMILSLQIPDGTGGYISFRAVILFTAMLTLSYSVIKIFLTKGQNNKYGKD